MKTRLNTITAAASLAFCLLAGAGHAFAQRTTTTQTLSDPGMKVISDNTLNVKGMIFPRLRTPVAAGKTGGLSCCNVGDSRNQDVMWANYRTPGVKPKGKLMHQRTDAYSPPSTCWTISTYKLTIFSERSSSSSLTAVPGGYSLVTSSEFKKIHQDLSDYVFDMNILNKYKIEIVAKLKQFTDNYAMYTQQLSVTHKSILLYTELFSEGRFGGDSWFTGTVHATETCCPLEIQDPAVLKTALMNWINDTVSRLPAKVDPKMSTERVAPKAPQPPPNPEPTRSPIPR